MHIIKSSKSIFGLFVLVFFSNHFTFSQPKLVSQKITLKTGKSFSLKLPENFEIIPAAEGLKRVRFFAKSPDGRIFVTDMFDLTDNEKGKIYILDEFDAADGKIRQSRNIFVKTQKSEQRPILHRRERTRLDLYCRNRQINAAEIPKRRSRTDRYKSRRRLPHFPIMV